MNIAIGFNRNLSSTAGFCGAIKLKSEKHTEKNGLQVTLSDGKLGKYNLTFDYSYSSNAKLVNMGIMMIIALLAVYLF